MIIVLKPNTTEKNITRVENLVKNRGLDTHLVRGTEMTIIGCIGDTTLIDPRLFEVDESVDKVMHVQEPYKLANRAFHPEDSIIDVSGVQIGGDHLGLIAGPCSVESFEQVLEIAQKAKASGANLLRGGAFKPRTSPYSFQGLEEEGLRYMAEAGFEVTWQTRDLHADEPSWNIRTEHEQMFTEMGIPTKALIARKTSLPENAPAPCIPHDIME